MVKGYSSCRKCKNIVENLYSPFCAPCLKESESRYKVYYSSFASVDHTYSILEFSSFKDAEFGMGTPTRVISGFTAVEAEEVMKILVKVNGGYVVTITLPGGGSMSHGHPIMNEYHK